VETRIRTLGNVLGLALFTLFLAIEAIPGANAASPGSTQIQITRSSPGKCGGVGVATQESPALCNAYSLNPAVLVIGVNNTVVFHNSDDAAHSATSMNGSFDTGPLSGGASSSPITFSVPGRYPYYCMFHINMVGLIIVVQADASSGASSQASSGSGVPEFPLQLTSATVLATAVAASYLTVRHRRKLV